MNEVVKKADTQMVSTPADLISIAVNQNADVDKLAKLMELQERWEANEAKKAFNEAMSTFSQNVPEIERTKKAHNSMYAPLSEILAVIRPVLTENGLSISWSTAQKEDVLVTVTCCLRHVKGHQECTTMSAPPDDSGSKNNIQAMGSTVSYLERYTMNALLGLATKDQDNDGNFTISAEQAEEIRTKLKEVDGDEVKFCRFFKVKTLEELPEGKLGQALRNIESKRKVKK